MIAAEVNPSGSRCRGGQPNLGRTHSFGEAGRPEDLAELILFLASDESRYITGSEFSIDGGWRLMGRPKPASK